MLLIENNLLHYDSIMRTFKTTEKGLRFLDICNPISDMIKERQPQPQQQMWIDTEEVA
jgi:hypothetical protein